MKTEIKQASYFYPSPLMRELQILELLDENPFLSQAAIAREVDLAVAMVNRYITNFHNEGYIEKEAYAENRYVYRLTPRGKEKMQYHLFSYMAELLRLYSTVKERVLMTLYSVVPEQESEIRVVLYGAGEVAEVMFNALMGLRNVEIAGIIDDSEEKQEKTFYRFPIHSPRELGQMDPDVVIITSWFHAHEMFSRIRGLYGDKYKVVKLNARAGEGLESRH